MKSKAIQVRDRERERGKQILICDVFKYGKRLSRGLKKWYC